MIIVTLHCNKCVLECCVKITRRERVKNKRKKDPNRIIVIKALSSRPSGKVFL